VADEVDEVMPRAVMRRDGTAGWMGGAHGGEDPAGRSGGLSRRGFLAGAAAAGALAWTPVFRVSPASAQVSCAAPPAFPSGIPLYQQAWRNWSGELVIDALWTCTPNTPADIVTIANWARANGWRVRPRGMGHNWSPLTVTAGEGCDTHVVLVDTTQRLTAITVDTTSTPKRVTAQAGVTMDALLTRLEQSTLGLTATPAPGDLTIGGVLAIDAHGTAIPAQGETRPPGHTYGSLSNLVIALKAVVWDSATSQYVLRTFTRNDPQILPLLTHLGRTFVTEVTLQVGANQRLRCQSWFDIPTTQLFAAPGSGAPRTFASYVESAGRVEAIWFPFTTNPWLKVWSVKPTKPLLSRQVNSPYNYAFSDNVPLQLAELAGDIIAGNGALTPTFGQTQLSVVGAGLIATATWDIWGWSKNTLLYVRPTTLRVTANGYAILTRRADIQRVVHEFTTYYSARVAAYQAQGRYPMNGPVEIRVTGLDQQADVGVATAGPPTISAVRPRPDRPEWDVAVWLDILTIPGTPYANEFYREVEQWVFANYSGSYAAVRPEWSKGWGYTNTAPWADPTALGTTVPNAYRTGLPPTANWDTARAALNGFDPHRIFSNAFLDVLAP
jgi:FAD/FMN-containing dehydrogenase